MIEPLEYKWWEEAALGIATSWMDRLPLNYTMQTDQKRSLIPYATFLRESMDWLINAYQTDTNPESVGIPPNDLSDGDIKRSYSFCYKLMFEGAAVCIWELYPGIYTNKMQIVNELCELIASKQADYGPMNIWSFMHHGLVIRMNDKVARMENLAGRNRDAMNESVRDTFSDIMGYAVVGEMLCQDTFLLPLKRLQETK